MDEKVKDRIYIEGRCPVCDEIFNAVSLIDVIDERMYAKITGKHNPEPVLCPECGTQLMSDSLEDMKNGTYRSKYCPKCEKDNKGLFLLQTHNHIQNVVGKGREFMKKLRAQLAVHDHSKTADPELSLFLPVMDFKDYPYGSDEYIEQTRTIKPAIQEHYKNNQHHPESHTDGMAGFDLITLIEYYLDISEACQSRGDGDIIHSLEVNKERFNVPDMLHSILLNTAKKYGGF